MEDKVENLALGKAKAECEVNQLRRETDLRGVGSFLQAVGWPQNLFFTPKIIFNCKKKIIFFNSRSRTAGIGSNARHFEILYELFSLKKKWF